MFEKEVKEKKSRVAKKMYHPIKELAGHLGKLEKFGKKFKKSHENDNKEMAF